MMNFRKQFFAALLSMGLILALLPLPPERSLTARPQKLIDEALDQATFVTVDQVAKFIVAEDKTVQLIDLRTPAEFSSFNIPGSVNVPYNEFLDRDPDRLLE